VQALSSAGDFVIPPRRAEIHPRMELQRNKTDKNSVGLLARLMRSGWFEPVHAQGRASKRGESHAILRGELMAILDLAAGRRRPARPEVITNALAGPRDQIRC
jgi:hypothetical protein